MNTTSNATDPSAPRPVSLMLCRMLFHARWLVIACSIAIAWISVDYTVHHMGFVTRRSELVEANDRHKQLYSDYEEEFGETEELVVVIESQDFELNRQCTDRLIALLEAQPDLIKHVRARIDLNPLKTKALLFASTDTLQHILTMLRPVAPMLGSITQSPHLHEIFNAMRRQMRQHKSGPHAADAEDEALYITPEDPLELLNTPQLIIRQMQKALTDPKAAAEQSPWQAMFESDADQQMPDDMIRYQTLQGGRFYVVLIEPVTDDQGFTPYDAVIATVRKTLDKLQREFPQMSIGLTGKPVLNQDEFLSTQRDSLRASWLSLIGVALLFILAFRELVRPLITVCCLLIGVAWSMGYATLSVGHLNILSITCTVFLISLGIGYGIHLLARYEEELAGGRVPIDAMAATFEHAVHAILTSMLTTAAAFFTMALTKFKGIAELGVIAGGGLVLCALAMLTVLPAMLFCLKPSRNYVLFSAFGPNLQDQTPPQERTRQARILLIGALTLTGLLGWQSFGRAFDYNLLHLQANNLNSVKTEMNLIEAAGSEALFAVLTADSLDEVRDISERAEALPSVRRVDSIAPLLPTNQALKLRLIGSIQALLTGIRTDALTEHIDLTTLQRTLGRLKRELELGAWYTEQNRSVPEDISKRLREVSTESATFLHQLERMDPDTTADRLGRYQYEIFQDLIKKLSLLNDPELLRPMTADDLPSALRDRYIGQTGKYVLRAYPEDNIWNRPALQQFIQELRTVSPDWTGVPVNIYEYTGLLKRSYEDAGWYALLAIAVLLLLHFRSARFTIMALVPLILGITWMAGCMALLGLSFNPANIMTLPLVLGAGVDNGVHILHRFRENPNVAMIKTGAGRGIILTAAVTMIGFASLATASHRGIASLGIIMTIGIACTALCALTIFPSLLYLIHRNTPLNAARTAGTATPYAPQAAGKEPVAAGR